jgi:Zn-dependent protease with chaperone function
MAREEFPYPASPASVPEGYISYSEEHEKRQWITLAALMVFLITYAGLVALAVLVGIISVLLVPKFSFLAIMMAFFSLLGFIFLVKGLFKRQQKFDPGLVVEITDQEHPKLFGFLRQLCEEVGVEEPSAVYLQPNVNAMVVPRISLLNLFVKPKKDLYIGMGLVNCLTLSEFKAAMGHEFGHFAQDSWVGSYFFTMSHLCEDMIEGSDWYDRMVDTLISVGSVITLVGWMIYVPTVTLRWCLRNFYNLVAFQQYNVRREREFHADRVAASVAGSNSIVHCLYRLELANESLDLAFFELRKAADHKLYTRDFFFHQHAAAAYLRNKKKDPTLGIPPEFADPKEGKKVQVFDPEKSNDPTAHGDYHPSDFDREENVKKTFIVAPEDRRSAWILFDSPADLRERLTWKMYRKGLEIPKNSELVDPKKVQQFIDDEHAETTYDDKYCGVYDDRLIDPGDLDELNESFRKEPWDNGRLMGVFEKLWTKELDKRVEERKEILEELDKMYAQTDGASSKKTRRIIEELEEDLEKATDWFSSLDRRVYLVHVQMAYRVNEAYYTDLINRYRFHMAMQGIHKTARDQQSKAHFFANWAFGQQELSQDDFAEVSHVLRQARKSLKNILRDADDINMPAMKNFVEGEKLGDFLLTKELIREPAEQLIKGTWVTKLLDQLDEVRAKSHRLHFKSLGGILALQEKISKEFQEKFKGTLPAPVATPPG